MGDTPKVFQLRTISRYAIFLISVGVVQLSIFKISIRQIKAARSLLDWSQERLAEASGVSIPTVRRLEAVDGELGGRQDTAARIIIALESVGIEFTNGGQPGVTLKATRIPMLAGDFSQGIEKFQSIMRGDQQFSGLNLQHSNKTTSAKLMWEGSVVGTTSHRDGFAHFDPGVAHEPADPAGEKPKIEFIFADWAGAAVRREKQRRQRLAGGRE
jgi:transcriptional regulator with XRE-family HTH domain